jgi:hypothetical protein
MSVVCEFIVRWDATPEQLTALGSALWRWCIRTAGNVPLYHYLDDQPLADLIAGTLPRFSQSDQRGVRVTVRDESSPSRRATIASLRREMPVGGVEDIAVDGLSWKIAESKAGAAATV